MSHAHLYRRLSLAILVMLLLGALAVPSATPVLAAPSPYTSATVAGTFQSELGCPGDWQPECAVTNLTYNEPAGVYVGQFAVPAGAQAYKVAVNGTWDVSFGTPTGGDVTITVPDPPALEPVRFFFDTKTSWVGDSVRKVYTVPGDFNQEIGCAGDWAPDCLITLMSDPDGDGTFTFVTSAIPNGSYNFKVATNESWDNPNYGQGGGPDNIPFSVAGPSTVTFSFNSTTNTPSVSVQSSLPGPDNNVEWDGLRHDSRDTLYRTPGGAVPTGTVVTIRFRTLHNDVTGVALRVYDLDANGQSFVPMQRVASDVDCYQASLTEDGKTCDFWAATVTRTSPNNLWYRFVVTDGTDSDYYGDNTPALDGGLGTTTDDTVDQSYALMFHDPAFSSPDWARTAVIYQIFPDRFRNGRSNNDPRTGDIRYDDPVLRLPWGTLPEGYCRNYSDGATNCPWRFDTTPPDSSPTKESPRGRDYFGGDLRGVDQQLDYLKELGITTIYFNPIFDAGSNHSYDTQDYYRIDPYFGTQKDWENLVKHANDRGIRIILDSVFNHMSSDSALFDRYSHFSALGACESTDAPYRGWFTFRDVTAGTGSCVGSAGPQSTTYEGWFGFDSIPVITKSRSDVQQYFVTGPNSVSRYWLRQGAAGWRLDVMGDASFPAGYWESFREVTRETRANSLIIGELWQKDSTLLRHLRGQTADTTMNYRLRDAVLGLLVPQGFDSKGFGDSGRVISPSEFAARVQAIREDYPDAAYYTLMNLLGSHDTERILWTLTPGQETIADKELNATNLAEGKARLRLASLIQFTMPGAPTVYYGDEVGVTGDDDPDDRRTYPWADQGGRPDNQLLSYYKSLTRLRRSAPEFARGDLKVLLADDATGMVAYGRKAGNNASIVLINRGAQAQTVSVPVTGYLPDGTLLGRTLGLGDGASTSAAVVDGTLQVDVPARGGLVLRTRGADLTAPGAPGGLTVVEEGDGKVDLSWSAVAGAAGYNVYRSPVSGGGWVQVNASPVTGTSYSDTPVSNGKTYYYAVTALDAAGNESTYSTEVSALPHYRIGWANLQWPPALNHTVSVVNRTDTVYGQVWIDGVTGQPGATPGLLAQIGFGPDGSNPTGNSDWSWTDATFNVDAGNNDEFKASLLPEAVGTFDYAYRYSTTGGRDWIYADLDGIGNGYSPDQAGALTVNSSGDTTAPTTPTGLTVTSASPAGIALSWDAVAGDATLYGYEVLRGDTTGGPYTQIARVTGTTYSDTSVSQGATYYYVVRALDQSFNRSANSAEVEATANLRTVSLTFNVTVPATTDATGREVYIAGFVDRLDPVVPGTPNPQWDPGGIKLTRIDATTWRITFTGRESTQLEYKFTLGSWDFVEKGPAPTCDELANRTLTLAYGGDGNQVVNITVANWRNVAPCGN